MYLTTTLVSSEGKPDHVHVSFGDGVPGELLGEEEAHGGLDLAGGEGEGGLLVVAGELAGFKGNNLEDVIHERVHDAGAGDMPRLEMPVPGCTCLSGS